MKKKIAVFYFTQTGQLLEILDSVTTPLKNDANFELNFIAIKPRPEFPFPWKSRDFFQAFPESVKMVPCEIEPIDLSNVNDADLVIIAYQPWYLSPSIPFHAFFQAAQIKQFLNGKSIVTVIGGRNMWAMAQENIKEYIKDAGAKLVGNIVLRDRAHNLLSVMSVIRWLIMNKRHSWLFIPRAGVSDADIKNAKIFGETIKETLLENKKETMQELLVKQGAVEIKYDVLTMEKNAKRIFHIWAGIIIKKGPYGDKKRDVFLSIFKYYLIAVIYLISPIVTLIVFLTRPFRRNSIKKVTKYYQGVV